MPIPPLKLSSPSLGNVTQDISGGIANFAAGIAKQKEADRQRALDETMLKIKQMEVQSKGMGKQGNPTLREERLPDGSTKLSWFYPPENVSPDTASLPATSEIPAGAPFGPPAAASAAAPGTQQPTAGGRVLRPGPIVPTGKAGASPAQGYLSTPLPKEEDAAQWAPALAEGFKGVRDLTNRNPAAAQEGAAFLATLQFSADIPAFGNALADAIRSAAAQGLSEDAQKYIQSFLRYAAARQFASGGKALTSTEIRVATGQYAPSLNEPHTATMQKLGSMGTDFGTTLRLTGRAYQRIRAQIMAMTPEYDLGDFDIMTQSFKNQNTPPPGVGPVGANKYGYTK